MSTCSTLVAVSKARAGVKVVGFKAFEVVKSTEDKTKLIRFLQNCINFRLQYNGTDQIFTCLAWTNSRLSTLSSRFCIYSAKAAL